MGRTNFYFAYGSNMLAARLRARVADAVPIEPAQLAEHALTFNKRGRDGSGKCNVSPGSPQSVAGVVYRIDGSGMVRLDRIEGRGYRRKLVVISGIDSGRRYRAYCYMAKTAAIDNGCVAFEWYLSIVLAGASAHGLPPEYLEMLRGTKGRADPNRRRHRLQLARFLQGRHYG